MKLTHSQLVRRATEAAGALHARLLDLESRMPTWQPIDTAPKKVGGWILLHYADGYIPAIGFWMRTKTPPDWSCRARLGEHQPTHWMPLPAPPNAEPASSISDP